MDYNKFRDISCYEEFEIQCDLHGISKIDVLKEMKQIDNISTTYDAKKLYVSLKWNNIKNMVE